MTQNTWFVIINVNDELTIHTGGWGSGVTPKLYLSEKVAQNQADKLNKSYHAGGYVVCEAALNYIRLAD